MSLYRARGRVVLLYNSCKFARRVFLMSLINLHDEKLS